MPDYQIQLYITPRHQTGQERTLTYTVVARNLHDVANRMKPIMEEFQQTQEAQSNRD